MSTPAVPAVAPLSPPVSFMPSIATATGADDIGSMDEWRACIQTHCVDAASGDPILPKELLRLIAGYLYPTFHDILRCKKWVVDNALARVPVPLSAIVGRKKERTTFHFEYAINHPPFVAPAYKVTGSGAGVRRTSPIVLKSDSFLLSVGACLRAIADAQPDATGDVTFAERVRGLLRELTATHAHDSGLYLARWPSVCINSLRTSESSGLFAAEPTITTHMFYWIGVDSDEVTPILKSAEADRDALRLQKTPPTPLFLHFWTVVWGEY